MRIIARKSMAACSRGDISRWFKTEMKAIIDILVERWPPSAASKIHTLIADEIIAENNVSCVTDLEHIRPSEES